MVKDPCKVAMGKKSKASGAAFELRTRKDLEEDGWIVDKWSNNVECIKYDNQEGYFSGEFKLSPAKHKFRGMGIPMAMGTGFPDFIIFKPRPRGGDVIYEETFDIIGVECKTNGYLDKIEKGKCKWLLENNIFSKILIASKDKIKNKIVINYEDFSEKYG